MRTKFMVAGLSQTMNDEALEFLFSDFGQVESAQVQTNRDTGRSLGTGIVEIDTPDANTLMAALSGRVVDGRPIQVSVYDQSRSRPTRTGSRW